MNQQLFVEVEPLSDQRWARIERALMAELEAAPRAFEQLPRHTSSWAPKASRGSRFGARSWLWSAAALAAVVMAVFAVQPAAEHAALEHPSRITTGRSPSHLALPGLALEVRPESAVVVGAETEQGQLLVLDGGSIACQVAPRPSNAPLIVQAGGVSVRVVGTRFSVTRLGESARVQVHEGVVEVRAAGETERIGAGEEWPSRPAAEEARDITAVAKPQTATPPRASSLPVATPSVQPRAARREQMHTQTPTRESAGGARDPAGTDDTGRPSPQDVFEEATALESSDPVRASRLYGKLEGGSDSWAQNALFARGRLEASRGNVGQARRLLELYLERFPRGSNAEDARAVLRRLR